MKLLKSIDVAKIIKQRLIDEIPYNITPSRYDHLFVAAISKHISLINKFFLWIISDPGNNTFYNVHFRLTRSFMSTKKTYRNNYPLVPAYLETVFMNNHLNYNAYLSQSVDKFPWKGCKKVVPVMERGIVKMMPPDPNALHLSSFHPYLDIPYPKSFRKAHMYYNNVCIVPY